MSKYNTDGSEIIHDFSQETYDYYKGLEDENKELKLLNEKMKNCYNCNYSREDVYCDYYKFTRHECKKMSGWEIKN